MSFVYTAEEVEKMIALERRISWDQAIETAANLAEPWSGACWLDKMGVQDMSICDARNQLAAAIRALQIPTAVPNGDRG